MDDETIFYCKRELGDIMWYWINSVRSRLESNDVVQENVNKLKALIRAENLMYTIQRIEKTETYNWDINILQQNTPDVDGVLLNWEDAFTSWMAKREYTSK